jgi:hypothetical protein
VYFGRTMWKHIFSHPFFWTLTICLGAFLGASYFFHQPNRAIVHSLNSDAQGYYAYLPTAFIYGDWKFDYYTTIAESYGKEYPMPSFLNGTDVGMVNKYYCGVAILQAPFFLLAMANAALTGTPLDGFSPMFTTWLQVGVMFWVMLGLWALFAWLREEIGGGWASVTLVLLFLGTNLFYYTAFEFMMAHAYAFSVVSIFCLAVYRASRGSSRYHLLAAACGGLLIVIRPTDTLVALAIPFIAGSKEHCTTWWKSLWTLRMVVVAAFMIAIPIALQSLAYTAQTGEAWVYAYGGEGFDFLHPRFWEVLFGWRVGLFIYAPALLLALLGIGLMMRKAIFQSRAWLLFILLNTWVISSWWAWHYEGTFGMRPYIDFLPLFALPMGWFFVAASKNAQRIAMAAAAFFIFLAQFQSWQRFEVIIPWSHMTREKYATLFLESNPKYRWVFSDQDFYPLPKNTDSIATLYWADNMWGKRYRPFSFSGIDEAGVVLVAKKLQPPGRLLQLDIQGKVNMQPAVADAFVMLVAFKDGAEVKAPTRKLLSYASKDATDSFFFFNPTEAQWGPEADSVVILLRNYADSHITFTDLRLVEAWQHHEETAPYPSR